MAIRTSLNVSLEPIERTAIEWLFDRLRTADPVKYEARADVLRDLLNERMVRELGPQWRTSVAPSQP